MKENKTKSWLTIAGLIALIAALFLCVELIFLGLGRAIPNQAAGSGEADSPPGPAQETPAPSGEEKSPAFCPFCGEGLPSSFRWGQFCPWCGERVEP